jgi:hypothetical protein
MIIFLKDLFNTLFAPADRNWKYGKCLGIMKWLLSVVQFLQYRSGV